MRLGKKGMASMMDAMLFIVILGIAVSVIFVHMPYEHTETSAKEIHNDLFRTELKVSDVFDIEDTRVMPLSDLLAAYLSSGNGNVPEYIRKVLETRSKNFRFICSFDHNILEITSNDPGDVRSSYSEVIGTPYGVLHTSLEI